MIVFESLGTGVKTAKITEEPLDRNQNFLTTSPYTTYNTAGLLVKLNPLNPLTANVPII